MPTPEQFNLIRDTFGLPFDSIQAAEREVVGQQSGNLLAVAPGQGSDRSATTLSITAPATPEAQQWAGWGTALKPALEPITMARKPLEGTVAANVLAHGTGGLNVDGCRVNPGEHVPGGGGGERSGRSCGILGAPTAGNLSEPHTAGRWPANLIHDGSDEVVGLFPETGVSKGTAQFKTHTTYQWSKSHPDATAEPQYGAEIGYGDTGSAARFFYTAKASRQDRSDGNTHPTVKPTDLMRYLCRLVTPTGGIVLDPFMGSGSTGKAAMLEGFDFIGIERDPAYYAIAERRIGKAAASGHQPSLL